MKQRSTRASSLSHDWGIGVNLRRGITVLYALISLTGPIAGHHVHWLVLVVYLYGVWQEGKWTGSRVVPLADTRMAAISPTITSEIGWQLHHHGTTARKPITVEDAQSVFSGITSQNWIGNRIVHPLYKLYVEAFAVGQPISLYQPLRHSTLECQESSQLVYIPSRDSFWEPSLSRSYRWSSHFPNVSYILYFVISPLVNIWWVYLHFLCVYMGKCDYVVWGGAWFDICPNGAHSFLSDSY